MVPGVNPGSDLFTPLDAESNTYWFPLRRYRVLPMAARPDLAELSQELRRTGSVEALRSPGVSRRRSLR
jgi:hypothetical protein